eukprot:UN30175
MVDQFLSPFTNQRTDKYGGSLEKRMTFPLEVIEAVRKEVGPDYFVSIRLACEERMDFEKYREFYNLDDGVKITETMARQGMLDVFNLTFGQVSTHMELATLIPNMMSTKGFGMYLEQCKIIREAVQSIDPELKVFHAGRINDLSTARNAVEQGYVDMIGMTRAHIADPHIVKKLAEGREEDIRPCVGAGYCIDRIYMGGEALCLHSPATGREKHLNHEIEKGKDKAKNICIIGAGIGGLEAARICAIRGHNVTVFEAQS